MIEVVKRGTKINVETDRELHLLRKKIRTQLRGDDRTTALSCLSDARRAVTPHKEHFRGRMMRVIEYGAYEYHLRWAMWYLAGKVGPPPR